MKMKVTVLILIIIIVLLSSIGIYREIRKELNESNHLKYKLLTAEFDYVDSGRFQILEHRDSDGYTLEDEKTSARLFLGEFKKYKKIGKKVYFIHSDGFTILDFKNMSLKQYIDFNKLNKSDADYFNSDITRSNKESFGMKWILLKTYNEFSLQEKEVFEKLRKSN